MVNKDVRDARHEQEQLEALHRLDEECVHLQRAGNYLEAFNNMERALVLRRHFFGADSPEVIHACRALAEMCNLLSMSFLQQGNFAVTLELLKKAEILSNHPKEKATTLNNLACYYRRLGKLHTAMTCLKKALSIEKKTLQDARNAADTHLNICAVLSQLGKHQQALEHAQAALITLQEEFFNKPKATNAGETEASQANTQQLERVSVVCIAYHNMGVEQEFLHDYEGCVLSYKKGVGLAEQYLGVDHAITTTIRNSYLAAKRTISTKASSSRRGNAGVSPVAKPNPRLSTPPSSLRLPSPVARDKQQSQELPSPRSIVADALARGNTLPPLEPLQKKKTPLLTPEDPFFSPRFRFDGGDTTTRSATKPKSESPRVIIDQPETISSDERVVVETETASTALAETIEAATVKDDDVEPTEVIADTIHQTEGELQGRQGDSAASIVAEENAVDLIEEPVFSNADPPHEPEVTTGQLNRTDDDSIPPQNLDDVTAPMEEPAAVVNAVEESEVDVNDQVIHFQDDQNQCEPADQAFSEEIPHETDTTDANGPVEGSEHTHEDPSDDSAPPHRDEFRGEMAATSELSVETLPADQTEHEAEETIGRPTGDQEASHEETEPTPPYEATQWEVEHTTEDPQELLVEDQDPNSERMEAELTQVEVVEAPETSSELACDDQLHDQHAEAVAGQLDEWHESNSEVDAYAHAVDQLTAEEVSDHDVARGDTTEFHSDWTQQHGEEELQAGEHVGFGIEEETPVSSGEQVANYDSQPPEEAWDPSHHAADDGNHFEAHAAEGEDSVFHGAAAAYTEYPAEDLHDHEHHTAQWSSHELTTEGQHYGHESAWDSSQATDHDVGAHDLHYAGSAAVYAHGVHEESLLPAHESGLPPVEAATVHDHELISEETPVPGVNKP